MNDWISVLCKHLSRSAAISSHHRSTFLLAATKKTTSSFRRFYLQPDRRGKTRQDRNLNHSKTKNHNFGDDLLIESAHLWLSLVVVCFSRWKCDLPQKKSIFICARSLARSQFALFICHVHICILLYMQALGRLEVSARSNCFIVRRPFSPCPCISSQTHLR